MRIYLSVFVLLLFSCSHSQNEVNNETNSESDWPHYLSGIGIDSTIAQTSKYRFQMVFTAIRKGSVDETFSFGTEQYYYPASLVKIPVTLLALEKMKRLGISLDDVIVFDTINACGSTKFVELSQHRKMAFRQMFTELLVVSDNHFYNALYHFLGPKEIHEKLKQKGFDETYIFRAFTGCDRIEQLHTYPWQIYSKDGKLVAEGNEMYADSSLLSSNYTQTEARLFGSSHENEEGEIVEGPYDLNFTLEMKLENLQEMMLRLLFPENYSLEVRWDLSEESRAFILNLMQKYPSEIHSIYRNLKSFDDTVYKYAHIESDSRTTSKLGLSYGFASETVYYEIPNSTNAFLLTYSVYVNANDCVNDGKYEYEEVARPFAQNLIVAMKKYMEMHTDPPQD